MDVSFSKKAGLANEFPTPTSASLLDRMVINKTHISPSEGVKLHIKAQEKKLEALAKTISEDYDRSIEDDNEQPVLRSSDKRLTNKAQVLLVMARYQSLSNNMDSNKLATALSLFLAQSEARIQKAQEMSEYLDSLHKEFDVYEENINTAQEEENGAYTQWSNAEKKLSEAKKNLSNIQSDSEASSEDIANAKKGVAIASKTLAEAMTTLNSAKNKTKQALEAAQKILNVISAKTAEMNKEYGDIIIPAAIPVSNAIEQSEKAMTRTSIMIMLLTEFIMKMDESSADKLQSDLEMNRIQMKARQAEMKRKSDEYEEQVRKAEEAQKMAGCIGKILGGLAIALGAICTVFGGGGPALMAIGIGLMIADPIIEAITGESLTGMIMNPLMQHILMPLMDLIGDIVTKIFDFTPIGQLLKAIDKATGANMMDTIHTIVTAAAAIGAIVAIAMLAKSAAKFIIDKMSKAMTSAVMQAIKKAIVQVIKKVIPKIVRNAVSKGGAVLSNMGKAAVKQLNKLTSQISKKMDKISAQVSKNMTVFLKSTDSAVMHNLAKININHINMLRAGVEGSNVIIQSGMNINIANIQLEASKALAQFQLANSDTKILRDLLSTIFSRFRQDHKLIQSVGQQLTNSLQVNASTNRFIVQNIKA
ncbi:type III secretion system translocon subunit SctE [Erwinia sp. HDF1-3R]|uniref:type III secretion system translocon subunit SctE n=1 Tax=Erwinia sp. HDF1-3R TaxID=3141543 RepID=UPI0031F49BE6